MESTREELGEGPSGGTGGQTRGRTLRWTPSGKTPSRRGRRARGGADERPRRALNPRSSHRASERLWSRFRPRWCADGNLPGTRRWRRPAGSAQTVIPTASNMPPSEGTQPCLAAPGGGSGPPLPASPRRSLPAPGGRRGNPTGRRAPPEPLAWKARRPSGRRETEAACGRDSERPGRSEWGAEAIRRL